MISKYNQIYRLNINSINRENLATTTSSDFNITMGYPIVGEIIETRLMQAIIPNVFELFKDANDTLQFTDSTGANSITITHGTYNVNQLITHLLALFAVASPDTYAITFDFTTLKLTITSNFVGFVLDFTNLDTPAYNLGWERGSTTAAGLIQVAPNVIDLLAYKNVYINLDTFPKDMYNIGNLTQTMFNYQVAIVSSYSEVNFYFPQSQSPQVHIFNEENGMRVNLQYLRIRLVDDTNRPIDLRGRDFQFTIEFKIK